MIRPNDCAPAAESGHEQKHLTVGVAGHVDHGKTALVGALTGMQTDTLAEERERGMSIVLGFAYSDFAGGSVDFIDVPGHERFVKTMISGAGGIGLLLLAVDSVEGPMPQTREHLALASLLGVRRGVIALTKCDRIAPGLERGRLRERMRAELSATPFSAAPVLFVSAHSGEGLEELRATLAAELANAPTPIESPYFTLPVDRAFSIAGHGTVVTGTLRYGRIRVGETVDLGPGIRGSAAVRGLQVHGRPVDSAGPGRRVAVNLRGDRVSALMRGAVLASAGYLAPTRRVDAAITVLDGCAPLVRGAEVMLHIGAGETAARVFGLDTADIEPGQTALAQLRLGKEIAAPFGEPFVIRGLAPAATVGGGTVLDGSPPRHSFSPSAGAAAEASATLLRALASGTPAHRIAARLAFAGIEGIDSEKLCRDFRLRPPESAAALAGQDFAVCGPLVVGRRFCEAAASDLLALVSAFHSAHRLRAGIMREELRTKLGQRLPIEVFRRILADLAGAGKIELDGPFVRIAGYRADEHLTAVESRISAEIEALYKAAALHPPDERAAVGSDRRRKALRRMLIESGRLVALPAGAACDIVLHADTIADAAANLAQMLAERPLTISEIDHALGMTRRVSIPLLQHLDRDGVTNRRGDLRYSQRTIAHEED